MLRSCARSFGADVCLWIQIARVIPRVNTRMSKGSCFPVYLIFDRDDRLGGLRSEQSLENGLSLRRMGP